MGRFLYQPRGLSGRTQGSHQNSCSEECDEHDPGRAHVHGVKERVIGSVRESGLVDRGRDMAGLFGGDPRLVLRRPGYITREGSIALR